MAEIAAAADGARLTAESWTDATPFDRAPGRPARGACSTLPGWRPAPATTPASSPRPAIPTAMLFVRNPTGVSHSPAEFAEEADCRAGVAALTTVLADLAGDRR